MTRTEFFEAIYNEVETNKRWSRSAWGRGVSEYVVELLDNIESDDAVASPSLLRKALLNGAEHWPQYSYGGCSLVYDADIAERLCTPSELKKTRGGDREPNRFDTWLDVQARALSQAAKRIMSVWHKTAGRAA